MAKITNIINEILGAGTNRRKSTTANTKIQKQPVWEVRAKFDKRPRGPHKSS